MVVGLWGWEMRVESGCCRAVAQSMRVAYVILSINVEPAESLNNITLDPTTASERFIDHEDRRRATFEFN